ncbi:MAG: hypothetical protein NZ888_03555 [Candidatus Nitrosocaldus sp.]|nr:hypothetical protein [Candidatus Nitrosocaldus sp.]MCS7141245.1 hypothetical protein [Candidatus Nitrosocaldus sp.]MDW8000149.1 hypothetical protein [Candidatus Nitrosocaldus sp.]
MVMVGGMRTASLKALLPLLLLLPYTHASAHQLFNSGEYRIAGYLVQVATQPEIPAPGSIARILVRVADSDGNDLRDVTLGLSIFKNDTLVHAFSPMLARDGHLEINYIFEEPGVYVIVVDVYNSDGSIVTAKFNVGIVREFGYIFISMVVLGATMPAAVVAGIMIYKRRSKEREVT